MPPVCRCKSINWNWIVTIRRWVCRSCGLLPCGRSSIVLRALSFLFVSIITFQQWPGLSCWGGMSAPTWRSCWWAPAVIPPLEIELTGTVDLPPPAEWRPAATEGPCHNVVSYAIYRVVSPREGEPVRGYAERRLAMRCPGDT